MLDMEKPLRKLACGALCCAAAAAAVAGPPGGGNSGGLFGKASGMLSAAPAAAVTRFHSLQPLDLRPPESASARPAAMNDSVAAFPSAKQSQASAARDAGEDLPGGGRFAPLPMESKVQEMERRVPREGLPVARLWETKSALLHVGLSPKGKPGLWLIQKVP
jgi:hypothetical protein